MTDKKKHCVKVDEENLKRLKQIKDYFGYRTLNETIDMCAGEYIFRYMCDHDGFKR